MNAFYIALAVAFLASPAVILAAEGEEMSEAMKCAMKRLGPVLMGIKVKSIISMAHPEPEQKEFMEMLMEQTNTEICPNVTCALCIGNGAMKEAMAAAAEACMADDGMEAMRAEMEEGDEDCEVSTNSLKII